MSRHLVAITLLLVTSIASASNVTIDFENDSGPYTSIGTVIFDGRSYFGLENQGFDILSWSFAVGDAPFPGIFTPGTFGSTSFYVEACCSYQDGISPSADFVLARSDGGSFSLLDMDFRIEELVPGWPGGEPGFSFVRGTTTAGGFVDITTPFGTGGWLDVQSVRIFSGSNNFANGTAAIEVDNIVVGAAVPLPAAVWLFGSALAGLGWMRRRSVGSAPVLCPQIAAPKSPL